VINNLWKLVSSVRLLIYFYVAIFFTGIKTECGKNSHVNGMNETSRPALWPTQPPSQRVLISFPHSKAGGGGGGVG
jgi:hypothetical protein